MIRRIECIGKLDFRAVEMNVPMFSNSLSALVEQQKSDSRQCF